MDMNSPIPFEKMHGSGNDFVVIHEKDLAGIGTELSDFVRAVCRHGMSVGADGVIVIGASETADFSWHYINADGSDGDMCGNGAMVGACYAVNHGIASATCSFSTAAGLVRAEVGEEQVSLQMMDAQTITIGLNFEAMPDIEFDQLMLGVPHVVGYAEDVDAIDNLDAVGRAIRNDEQVQPAGANVNLINVVDANTIRMRTYERGVEAETLACGTGAVCCAIAASRRELVQQPVRVKVSSGMHLTVSWQDEGEIAKHIQLTGTARTVARGELLPESLL